MPEAEKVLEIKEDRNKSAITQEKRDERDKMTHSLIYKFFNILKYLQKEGKARKLIACNQPVPVLQ